MKPPYRMGLSPIRAHDDVFVVCAAFRYVLGRRSYAPGLVMDWIKARKDCLPNELREQIAREIHEYNNRGQLDGDRDYQKQWLAFADLIAPKSTAAQGEQKP